MENNKAEIIDQHRKKNGSGLNLKYKALIC